MIDRTGERFDRLVVEEFAFVRKGHRYWRLRCDCGNLVERPIQHMRRTKHHSCLECHRQNNHHAWRGVGELGSELYTSIKHSADERGLRFAVTKKYLWELFLAQNRRCALSGQPLVFGTLKVEDGRTASLDRIDSTLGYVKGNVQWVHSSINKMKRNLPNDQFIELCKKIASHHRSDCGY